MIPSSEVFRPPRACSSIPFVPDLRHRVERPDAAVSCFFYKLLSRCGRTGRLVMRRQAVSLGRLCRQVVEKFVGFYFVERCRFCDSVFQGGPTSTSRTVTPPAIFAVLMGGMEGELGWCVGWLRCRTWSVGELGLKQFDYLKLVNFFRVGFAALAGEPTK